MRPTTNGTSIHIHLHPLVKYSLLALVQYTHLPDTDIGLETGPTNWPQGNTRVLMVSTNGVHIAPAGATGAGANQALLVDDIVMDTQTISTLDSNKNLILAPHGSGSVELGAVSSNATSVITTPSAHNVIGTSVSIQAGSTTAGTTNNIGWAEA